MKKPLFFILLVLFPLFLHANRYCILIDTIPLTLANKHKINSILLDVPYPSTQIIQNTLSIYSGKFKKKETAKQLLALTRTRYKNSHVAKCDGTKLYKGENLFKKVLPLHIAQPEKQKVLPITMTKTKKLNSCYTIEVFQTPISKKKKYKNKINYILNRLPQTRTATLHNTFTIYSGKFDSKETANTINKLLKNEFQQSKVISCINEKYLKKYHHPIRPPRQEKIILLDDIEGAKKQPEPISKQKIFYVEDITPPNPIESKNESKKKIKKSSKQYTVKTPNQNFTDNFSVLDLDNHGYLSREITSQRYYTQESQLKKSDAIQAYDLQKANYFNGLYLKSNTAYDLQNSDSAYDVRVEFDLFDQGYYKYKKKNHKNKIKNEITFYKTLQHIEVLKREQELLKIQHYKNSVNVTSLLLKLRIKEKNLHTAYQKMQAGILTAFEYEKFVLDIQEIKDELLLYSNMTLLKIPHNLWNLLNEIENTKLISEKQLLSKLHTDSIDIKLVNAMQEQEPLKEEWKDLLRVNFYAGVRKMYLSQSQTLVGIEAKIPLSYYSDTREVETIQNKVLTQQTRVQQEQSQKNLHDAIARFKYQQQKLKTYTYQLSRLQKHIKNLDTIHNSAYSSYANFNPNDEQSAIDTYLRTYTKLQLQRVETYKELIKIMYLIHTDNLKNILLYSTDS